MTKRTLGIRSVLALGTLIAATAFASPAAEASTMAIDCDGATADVQDGSSGTCMHEVGADFTVQVRVTEPPAAGYRGVDTNLEWTAPPLLHVPRATAEDQVVWPDSTIAARSKPDGSSSVAIGAGIAGISSPSSNWTGPITELDFQCTEVGTSPIGWVNTSFAHTFTISTGFPSGDPVFEDATPESASVECVTPRPVLSGTDPPSPANNNNPKVKGTAPAGSTVTLYTNASCSGSPVATGTEAQLSGAGIPVPPVAVGDDTATDFYGTAEDASNNLSPCSTTSVTYVEDSTAPDTSIDSGPSGTSADPAPVFGFSASESASTFVCSFDGSAYAPCTSPKALGPLADGAHVFSVLATDAAHNTDASAANRTFTIDTKPVQVLQPPGPTGQPNKAKKKACASLKGKKLKRCKARLRCKKIKAKSKRAKCLKRANRIGRKRSG